MTSRAGRSQVQIEPALLEEAVLLAAAAREGGEADGAREALAFHDERDRLYAIGSSDRRESAFHELSGRWAGRWRLTQPLLEGLATLPHRAEPPRCLVLVARSAREEGADLHGATGGPLIVVRLRPATLADPSRLRELLARELLHVADLLDPSFGFDPAAAGAFAPTGPAAAGRERYRLLWRATVDGRLGLAEGRRREEFVAAFAGAVEDPAGLFERLTRGPRPTHAELLGMAVGRGGGGPRAEPG